MLESLRDLPGYDAEEVLVTTTSVSPDDQVDVVGLHRNLLQFHEEVLRVVFNDETGEGEVLGRAEAASFDSRLIGFKNQVDRAARREWATSTAQSTVAKDAAASEAVRTRAVVERRIVTDTPPPG